MQRNKRDYTFAMPLWLAIMMPPSLADAPLVDCLPQYTELLSTAARKSSRYLSHLREVPPLTQQGSRLGSSVTVVARKRVGAYDS